MLSSAHTTRHLLSKVPEVTLFFWIIKILCTTVGETAADFLNINLNFGLTVTSIFMGLLLIGALIWQFRSKVYVPGIYWFTVVSISIFGTLVTDNLTDNFDVPLEISTIVFSVLLLGTFWWWYRAEGTLSIHSIFTRKREIFYWLAILWTFALGTAAGDLLAEGLGFGYVTTGLLVAGAIAIMTVSWRMGLQSVLAFWIIYILTRPLGASLGDFLTQPPKYGGLGFGVATTSALFGIAIIFTIIYLTRTKVDVISEAELQADQKSNGKINSIQFLVLSVVVALICIGGYLKYQTPTVVPIIIDSEHSVSTVQNNTTDDVSATKPPLGDLQSFKVIVSDMMQAAEAGNFSFEKERAGDLEFEWDAAEATLKSRDKSTWSAIDDKIDAVLRQARSTRPEADKNIEALQALLAVLK